MSKREIIDACQRAQNLLNALLENMKIALAPCSSSSSIDYKEKTKLQKEIGSLWKLIGQERSKIILLTKAASTKNKKKKNRNCKELKELRDDHCSEIVHKNKAIRVLVDRLRGLQILLKLCQEKKTDDFSTE